MEKKKKKILTPSLNIQFFICLDYMLSFCFNFFRNKNNSGIIKRRRGIKGRGIGFLRGLVLVSYGCGIWGEEEAIKESQKQQEKFKKRKEKDVYLYWIPSIQLWISRRTDNLWVEFL